MSKITNNFKFKPGDSLFVTANPHCNYAALSNGVAAIVMARCLNLDTGELSYVYEDTTDEKFVGSHSNNTVIATIEYVENKYSHINDFPKEY